MEVKEIHSRFYKSLLHYIMNRVQNSDDAEDILQEVFIKISSKIDTLSDNQKIKSWIFAITRNSIIDYYRKNSNNKRIEISDKIINEIETETDFDSTKGLDKCLKEFIQHLPPEYRDIIIDSEIKGIKQKDLAGKYNIAYPSVRSRVQRGRIRLKEMLLNCCRIESDSRGNIMKATSKDNCGNNCNEC